MKGYENFVKTTDLKVDADDDIQFYLDGMNEEHGEISGVIKRARRGDYDNIPYVGYKPSEYLMKFGLKDTVSRFEEIRLDLIKEIGDHHWYETRFIQVLGISWSDIEKTNMEKLVKRSKQNQIIGKGSNRENV